MCEYVNLYVSIDTVDKIKNELACIAPEIKKGLAEKVHSFMTDIPSHISDKDFKNGVYNFSGFTEI